jgi:hypothetical protein
VNDEIAYPKGLKVMAVILILFAAGMVLSWYDVLFGGMSALEKYPGGLAHYGPMTSADVLPVTCLLICGIGLLRRRPWALAYGLVAGGAITFMAIMETHYNIQTGTFSSFSSSTVEAIIICVPSLIVGPAASIYLWRKRLSILGQ